jgi:hypothetical protein
MKPNDIINLDEFFAPVQYNVLDQLIIGYNKERQKIEGFLTALTEDYKSILYHFERPGTVSPTYKLENAILSLNAAYWTRALQLTNVFDLMPQKRKTQWNNQLTAWKDEDYKFGKNPDDDLPDFTEENVKTTLMHLIEMRQTFFAEKVDGIFRSLSGAHVTNRPEGFSKRMIISGVLDKYKSTDWAKCGYIADLRNVIAKFMGRDEVNHGSTDLIVKAAYRQTGEWLSFDGGALRIRVYMVGTAHLEVHPEMSYRLNSILASLYPRAIPSKFIEKPKKKLKDFEMMQRPLPFAVLKILQDGTFYDKSNYQLFDYGRVIYQKRINSFEFKYHSKRNKVAYDEAVQVLKSIGGVLSDGDIWFDYDAESVIESIIITGGIPDKKCYQYYPTSSMLAERVVRLAEIKDSDICLEPSAGQGGIAEFMPKERTMCVEISELHCEILRKKGFDVFETDFLKHDPQFKYDVICMNPPFSEGRAKAHVEHAITMLKSGGRLVAILPSSFIGKSLGKGKETWTDAIDNAFSDASISVTIYKIEV